MHLSSEQISKSIREIIREVEGYTLVPWSSKPLVNRYVNDILHTSRFVKTSSETKILDLGCGPGVLSLFWRRLNCDVFAVERKEIMKDQAGFFEREGIKYLELDLNSQKLPFDDEMFDLVLFLMVVEHLHFPPRKVLSEICRVLKAEGYLIFQTSNQASLYNRFRLLFGRSIHPKIEDFFDVDDFDDHVREYTHSEVAFMIKKAGLQIVKTNFHNYMASSKATQFSGLRRLAAGFYLALCRLVPSFRYEIVMVCKKGRK